MVAGKNGRVKGKNRGEWEGAMKAKKSMGGQEGGQMGQTGKEVTMLMIKVRGPKQMAAYNACKVAEWIGDFAGRGPEVKVERTM